MQPSGFYAIALLIYQTVVMVTLHVVQISPLCSKHVMLFLRLYIPLLLLGMFFVLRLVAVSNKKRKFMNEAILFLYGLSVSLIGACIYHVSTVLLGAAFTEGLDETFTFSCLCSTLTVFPLFIVHEARWEDFLNYLPDTLNVTSFVHDAVKVASCCTVIGAWAGAFPIPLDWDRDWQSWPITCCVGAICGNIIGLLYVSISCMNNAESFMVWKSKLT